MKGHQPLFSSGKDNWRTPQALFDALHAEFSFTIDAAADSTNHLLPRWLGPGSPLKGGYGEDALQGSLWAGERVWCNPPYSMCRQFVAHAAGQMECLVVMLIPARTDTRWFHTHLYDIERWAPRPRVTLRFLKGRLKFGDPEGKVTAGAPFPSLVAIIDRRSG